MQLQKFIRAVDPAETKKDPGTPETANPGSYLAPFTICHREMISSACLTVT